MAFSFGNSGNAMLGNAAGAGGLNIGPDLETIQTEVSLHFPSCLLGNHSDHHLVAQALGFLSIAGDAKVRLTTSWPSLPSSTASLLSIASRKGLVAAAGPDQVILATTESVRKAFEAPKDGDSDIRRFEPQLRIPMPMRVSQLYFTADENYLILSAESGGGLAVYEVQSLLQNSTNSAFELSTNGETLRALIPNPTPEKAELCAIVTTNGNLHMANLKERQISNPLKTQVSCVSWSSKGKQLCAGLADGTIHQMTPEGEAKAEIPKPPNMGDYHVSTLTWLENNLWLSIHTTNNETPPTSIYHIINRQPPSSFTFQKLTDPVEPFGSEKTPHHSILRLRDFPPAVQDLLIVSSTAATEMGVLSRSKAPLASDKPADSITGVFTTTEFLDDTKRPTLPMTDSMDDSTPVGVALDLSSKDKVYKPIPSDVELEESPGPLPGFWVLTHEGVLCSWWVVYNDSIKQGSAYPGLVAADGSGSASAPALAPAPAAAAPSASPFSNPGASAFGSAVNAPSAFGASSQLGQKASPWGGAGSTTSTPSTGGAAFGSSTFGAPTPAAPAFGQTSAIGFGQSSPLRAKQSPWGTPSTAAGAAPAFGKSGFASFAKNDNNQSAFGSAASTSSPSAAPSGGFAGFSSQSGFASVAKDSNSSSVFGSGNKPSVSAFGSSANTDTAFPAKQDNASGSVFGSTPFKLESSFKPDPSAKEDHAKTAVPSGSSLFGSSFSSALTDPANKPAISTPTSATNDEAMGTMDSGEETPQAKPKSSSLFPAQSSPESTTPTTTPAPSKFGLSTTPAPTTSVFGQPSKFPTSGSGLFGAKSETPSTSGGSLFGSQQSTPKPTGSVFGSTPKPGGSVFGSTPKQSSYTGIFGQKSEVPKPPQIKLEEGTPLPPDATSRSAFPVGHSSSSSAASNAPSQPQGATTASAKPDAAPLPPDFTRPTPAKTATDASEKGSPTEAPLPPDFVNVSKPVPESTAAENAPLPSDSSKPPTPAVSNSPLPPNPFEQKESNSPLPPNPFASLASNAPLPSDSDSDDESPDNTDDESDLEEDDGSEGSGIDVAKDLSPSTTGLAPTPGFTPQSSFGGIGGITPASIRPGQDASRPLFGEISRNAPMFPRPNATSPRSPSPLRSAVPNRVIRMDATRSVSAPGMASQILGPKKSQFGASIKSREPASPADDPFMVQHRKLKARQEAEETQPLVDEDDEEVQKILASEIEGTLSLDEFIAHSNVAPPAKESIPSQVEAVYRDINSMIDTLGLNSRTLKSFIKGHTDECKQGGRSKDELEIPDDWVLCEIDELGEVLDRELYPDLEDGRVRDLDDKLDACQELTREMHRLRAKQEDLKQIIVVRTDPEQATVTQSLPLSAEQATQQNELRREFTKFSKLLAETEEALTLLKTRIVTVSSASGKGKTNVPTVEAVLRTITKMTSMVEKRSGDIDVLENQLRKVHIGSTSREGSPMTPQGRRSVMFSPESTPVRNLRHSFAGSISLGASVRATPPRKKLSGFSREEKGDLMNKRTRRQAVLEKLKGSVEKRGANVWNMEDIE
ncbi:Nucleoporin [Neonectria ditissima]|uniref:Nucleoporin n=1 Tax=Neonectria ditissima TaxID=78410 RepID=A0A0N8H772_9HYPO|nr:Nucleoporin [Neonectria ditissima]